jgi:hypothetical protein
MDLLDVMYVAVGVFIFTVGATLSRRSPLLMGAGVYLVVIAFAPQLIGLLK